MKRDMNKTKALLVVSAVTFPLAGYIYPKKVKHGLARCLVAYSVLFLGGLGLGVLEAMVTITDTISAVLYFARIAGYVLLLIFIIRWIVEDMLDILQSKNQATNSKSPVAA